MKKLLVKDVMTREVLTVRADWSVERLAEFFVKEAISGAPVTAEGGKLIGVVSLTDIVLHNTLPEKDAQTKRPHQYYLDALDRQYSKAEIEAFCIEGEPQTTVRDIMTPSIFKVNEGITIQKVADFMIKNNIHRVFVTREEKVIGILSAVDMLKVIRSL